MNSNDIIDAFFKETETLLSAVEKAMPSIAAQFIYEDSKRIKEHFEELK